MNPGDLDRLTQIEQRRAAATPAPWGWRPFGGDPENLNRVVVYPPAVPAWTVIADSIDRDEDAEFIAHAPEDIDFLLRRVREQATAIRRVRELRDDATYEDDRGVRVITWSQVEAALSGPVEAKETSDEK